MNDDGVIVSLDGKREVFKALPKQRLVFNCPAHEVFYGGMKGSAKTELLIARPLPLLAIAHRKFLLTGQRQNCRIVIFREQLTGASDDMIERARSLYANFDAKSGDKGWKKSEHLYECSSGAKVIFTHVRRPDDYMIWNGVQINGLGIDQAENTVTQKVFKFLGANVRSTDPEYDAAKFYLLTGNPGGKYVKWLYDYFVKPNKLGGEFIDELIPVKEGTETVTRTRVFIRALLKDNPYYYNDGQYEANLRSLPPHMVKWYLGEDWEGSVNGFFSDMLDEGLHFQRPFSIPRTWQIGVGLHYEEGTQAYACVVVRNPSDQLFVIDETAPDNIHTPVDLGNAVQKMFKRQHWTNDRKWPISESTGYVNPSDEIETGIASTGLSTFPDNASRVEGWRQIRRRFKRGTDKKAALYVFKARCPRMAEQLAQVGRAEKDPTEIDPDMENDALNALRHVCSEWPLPLHFHEKSDDEEVRKFDKLLGERPDSGMLDY